MDEDDVDRLIELAFKRLQRCGGDLRRLPDPERTIVIVASAQGVIGNGGFQYFFEMNWPNRPDYRVFSDAYRRIGAKPAASKIDRAAAMFPFAEPHRSAKRRNQFMGSLPEKHVLFRLGDAVCLDRSVMVRLNAYVLAHKLELEKPLSRRQIRVRAGERGGRTSGCS